MQIAHPTPPAADIKACKNIFKSIIDLLATDLPPREEIERCLSRLLHVSQRLDRIQDCSPKERESIEKAKSEHAVALVRANDLYMSEPKRSENKNNTNPGIIVDLAKNETLQSETVPTSHHADIDSNDGAHSITPNEIDDLNTSRDRYEMRSNTKSRREKNRSETYLSGRNQLAVNFSEPYLALPTNRFKFPAPIATTPVFRSITNTTNSASNNSPTYNDHSQTNSNTAHSLANNHTGNNQIDPNIILNQLISALSLNSNNQNRPHNDRRIPINQWKISFSGDEPKAVKTDLNLFDFLNMAEVFRKSEDLSEAEMLRRIPYLMTGSAREWYTMNHHRFTSWNEVITLVKKRFVASDYDAVLFSEIINRKQRKNESIGNFISHMQSKFRAMSDPPNASHILRIIKANLSYDNALACSMHRIHTLEDLEEIIKCRECVRNTQSV